MIDSYSLCMPGVSGNCGYVGDIIRTEILNRVQVILSGCKIIKIPANKKSMYAYIPFPLRARSSSVALLSAAQPFPGGELKLVVPLLTEPRYQRLAQEPVCPHSARTTELLGTSAYFPTV